jgi:hypothetical protein
MRHSTADYPLAAALSDLEDYYRAGTFTGGLLGTTATLGAEAKFADLLKQDRIEITYDPTVAGRALGACVRRSKATADKLVALMSTPSHAGLAALTAGQFPEVAETLLQKARLAGICP